MGWWPGLMEGRNGGVVSGCKGWEPKIWAGTLWRGVTVRQCEWEGRVKLMEGGVVEWRDGVGDGGV